ncbi:MAG TPA: glycerophosphodiester phosphodiesterase [Caulobacteraceae bacterium]
MPPAKRPLVIAHRGASGERPEHTLASYRLALEQGADYLEPDLVMTRDGVLVCRHENEIGWTTDVASKPEFRTRRTTKQIDGQPVTGWFTEDFTLAELKTLRARERIPDVRPANTAHDGREPIPTFDELLALVARAARPVGVYPELKHPGWFAQQGLPMEAALLSALARAGLNRADAPVFIQCFEVGPLRALRSQTPVKLVQLASQAGGPADLAAAGRPRPYTDMLTATGLAEIATYADAVGVEKTLIVPRDTAARSLAPTALVANAHAAGLQVHAWTFRSENWFLPAELRRGASPEKGDFAAEYERFFALGIDGVFSDHPADAVRSAAAFAA